MKSTSPLDDFLNEVEARVFRLLGRDEQALIAALPLTGILAGHDRASPLAQLRTSAMRIDGGLDRLLQDRIRECAWDLRESVGEALGIGMTEAQGLLLLCQSLESELAPRTRQAARELLDEANEVELDDDAVAVLEQWRDRCGLPPEHPAVLAQVAAPLSAGDSRRTSKRTAAEMTVRLKSKLTVSEERLEFEEAYANVQWGTCASQKQRGAIESGWVTLLQPFDGKLAMQRTLSENWILTLAIESPVPIDAVRWEHRALVRDRSLSGFEKEKFLEVFQADLSLFAGQPLREFGGFVLDIRFADDTRLKVK